ncbi:MAG: hypothetical protein IT537_26580 [Hyphomicrobiales bacterium]|nr:hypothetical protein [Hyphomicrobiales bacterium]
MPKCAIRAVLAISLAVASASLVARARAETFVEHNAEFRMQLDFVVPDAALRTFLPPGWEPNIATQGPAKDCNVRMIFIDRVDVTGADGAPVASSRLVYLAVPVKQSAGSETGQMIIPGLTTDPKDAPGPFGNYQLATTHRMERSLAADSGKDTLVEERWELAAASGERLEVNVKYERAPARKGASTVKFFSPTDPSSYQIFKIEQGIDIMRNATVPIRDRVKEFSYKAAGGRLAPLFDGTERVVSIDSFHWYNRGVYLP